MMKISVCLIKYAVLVFVLVTNVESCNRNVKEGTEVLTNENLTTTTGSPVASVTTTDYNAVEKKCGSGCYKFLGTDCRCARNFFRKESKQKLETTSEGNVITKQNETIDDDKNGTKCPPGCHILQSDECSCSNEVSSTPRLNVARTLIDGNMPILLNRPTGVKKFERQCAPGCFLYENRECRCYSRVYHGDYD